MLEDLHGGAHQCWSASVQSWRLRLSHGAGSGRARLLGPPRQPMTMVGGSAADTNARRKQFTCRPRVCLPRSRGKGWRTAAVLVLIPGLGTIGTPVIRSLSFMATATCHFACRSTQPAGPSARCTCALHCWLPPLRRPALLIARLRAPLLLGLGWCHHAFAIRLTSHVASALPIGRMTTSASGHSRLLNFPNSTVDQMHLQQQALGYDASHFLGCLQGRGQAPRYSHGSTPEIPNASLCNPSRGREGARLVQLLPPLPGTGPACLSSCSPLNDRARNASIGRSRRIMYRTTHPKPLQLGISSAEQLWLVSISIEKLMCFLKRIKAEGWPEQEFSVPWRKQNTARRTPALARGAQSKGGQAGTNYLVAKLRGRICCRPCVGSRSAAVPWQVLCRRLQAYFPCINAAWWYSVPTARCQPRAWPDCIAFAITALTLLLEH